MVLFISVISLQNVDILQLARIRLITGIFPDNLKLA